MAILGPFTNAYVLVNLVDLSNHGRSVTISDERAAVDVSAFGSGFVQEAKGLGTATITIEFLQDFGAGSVHQTLQPLIASSTTVAVEVRPVNAARSTTNPAFVLAQALMFTYPALDGGVGDAAAVTAEFRNGPSGPGLTYLTA